MSNELVRQIIWKRNDPNKDYLNKRNQRRQRVKNIKTHYFSK